MEWIAILLTWSAETTFNGSGSLRRTIKLQGHAIVDKQWVPLQLHCPCWAFRRPCTYCFLFHITNRSAILHRFKKLFKFISELPLKKKPELLNLLHENNLVEDINSRTSVWKKALTSDVTYIADEHDLLQLDTEILPVCCPCWITSYKRKPAPPSPLHLEGHFLYTQSRLGKSGSTEGLSQRARTRKEVPPCVELLTCTTWAGVGLAEECRGTSGREPKQDHHTDHWAQKCSTRWDSLCLGRWVGIPMTFFDENSWWFSLNSSYMKKTGPAVKTTKQDINIVDNCHASQLLI